MKKKTAKPTTLYNIEKLKTIFTRISQKKSKWEAFNSILGLYLVVHKFYPTDVKLHQAEELAFSWPQKQDIIEFVQEIGDLQPGGFGDPLGEFYMHHLSGHYLTPEHAAQMRAQIAIGSESKAGQIVLDTACGSGRMLLAAATINRDMRFYGADPDATCCKMAVFNMIMNNLTGEIAHMDRAKNEFYCGFECKARITQGSYYPYFIDFTEPENSYIWQHPRDKIFSNANISIPTIRMKVPSLSDTPDTPVLTEKFICLADQAFQGSLQQGALF